MIKSIFSRKEFLIGFGFVVLDLVFLIVGGWLLTHQVIKSSQQLSDRKFALDNNLKASQTMYKDRQEMEKKKEEIDKIKQSFIAKNEPIGFINLMEDL
ncbi:MAG: hypothetical protein HY764_01380, partial [Candidatus Portnoybacteria bacterium]|nr:hypothetical protein [Candidatus Portnoybacteria bacterium]